MTVRKKEEAGEGQEKKQEASMTVRNCCDAVCCYRMDSALGNAAEAMMIMMVVPMGHYLQKSQICLSLYVVSLHLVSMYLVSLHLQNSIRTQYFQLRVPDYVKAKIARLIITN